MLVLLTVRVVVSGAKFRDRDASVDQKKTPPAPNSCSREVQETHPGNSAAASERSLKGHLSQAMCVVPLIKSRANDDEVSICADHFAVRNFGVGTAWRIREAERF